MAFHQPRHKEASSIADGRGVITYNIQPGIIIDYASGNSRREGEVQGKEEKNTYVVNLKSGKFHRESCEYADSISQANRLVRTASREEMLGYGYSPCGVCNP